MKKIIKWDKVWKSFNKWFDYRANFAQSWETQSRQIEKIVNRQLRGKK